MLSTIEGKVDGSGIRFWGDDEIELQFAALSVIGQVDAGINVLVGNAGVLWNIRVPILRVVSQVVIGLAGEFVGRCNLRLRISVYKPHTYNGSQIFLRTARTQDGPVS